MPTLSARAPARIGVIRLPALLTQRHDALATPGPFRPLVRDAFFSIALALRTGGTP